MTDDPFDLGDATIKDEKHVLVTRQAPRGGAACTYWKTFPPGGLGHAAYWTDRENRLIAGLWAKNVKRVVRLHTMTHHARPDASPVTEQIATFDAGLTVLQWLNQRPVYADGAVLAHPFQPVSALLALAWACLDALKNIHEQGYVHLDLRADNICLPYQPYPFHPAPGQRVSLDFDRLALIDFAFSISRDNPLKNLLPVQPTGAGQSDRLRQAIAADRVGAGGGPFQVDSLDWRCDLVSLGHMLEDIARRGGVLATPWPAGQAALRGLEDLIDTLKAYDNDSAWPGHLPHQAWMDKIKTWQRDLPDGGQYFSFAVVREDRKIPPMLEPTPVVKTRRRFHGKRALLALALAGIAGLALKLAGNGSADPPSTAIAPTMVRIPAGRFQMGCGEHEKECDSDESPRHEVTLPAFKLGQYEVTFAEWDACEAAKACPHADDNGWGRKRHPVINVSWNDAQTYISWLNHETGQVYRLPSEAEWEYAARAGTTTAFATGDCINTDQANYNGTADYNDCRAKTGNFLPKTQPVGTYVGNAWDLRDMHGNVWEWVQDCYHDNYHGAPDNGLAWGGGADCASGRRGLRGGSWYDDSRDIRSAERYRYVVGHRSFNFGFRLARTLTP